VTNVTLKALLNSYGAFCPLPFHLAGSQFGQAVSLIVHTLLRISPAALKISREFRELHEGFYNVVQCRWGDLGY